MYAKKAIREIEEDLPTITESVFMMNPTERFLCLIPYRHVRKHFTLNQNTSITIIDIGCGDGLFLQNFIGNTFVCQNNVRYVGIDMSLRKINFAKKAIKNLTCLDANLILADAEYLPFKDSVFNVGTTIEVLEHLLDPSALVSELARILRHDGDLIITTPSACGAKGNLVTCLKRLCLLKQSATHREHYITIQGKKLPHRDFTLTEVTDILLSHFNIVKIYGFNFKTIYHILAKFVPRRILVYIILSVENHASKLPKAWGNNWLIFAKNNHTVTS